jgi:hypothetical protein
MMARRITQAIVAAVFLSATGSVALACDLPKLVAIPAKDKIGDQGPQIQQDFKAYYDAMSAYSACVQKDLDAAGGNSAHPDVKSVLVQRNNAAVKEASEMMKVYNATFGGGAAPADGAKPEGGRRRDR